MAKLFFERIPIVENNDPMVDVASCPFIAEPAYYRQGLAASPALFMRRAFAEKLARLQETKLHNYQFKIWDPWRPRAVQAAIYQKTWDEFRAKNPDWDDARLKDEIKIYVSPPETPGRILQHATGGSVDLTLVDRATGLELDMGTRFDHFGPEAAPGYFEQPGRNLVARDNQRILLAAMNEEDFAVDPDEWWHFDYGNQKWAEAKNKETAFYGEITAIEHPASL